MVKNAMSNNRKIRTPWNQIPHEDRVKLAGGGREGYETRVKHNLPDKRY